MDEVIHKESGSFSSARVETCKQDHEPPMIGAILATVALLQIFPVAVVRAQGGPPLVTDDPDTPGPGYWRFNIATLLEEHGAERKGDLLHLDFNYGRGRSDSNSSSKCHGSARRRRTGANHADGDCVAGVKWRFLGQEKAPALPGRFIRSFRLGNMVTFVRR